MKLSPDETIFWEQGFITLNLTIVTTWVLMLVMVIAARLITRNLKTDIHVSRWQCFLEIVVTTISNQIREVGLTRPKEYIGFIGTLFLFIAFSNICSIVPWYVPPTGSLSTTTALAICVFLAVPFYGVVNVGFLNYFKSYVKPTFIMLPFNLIGEASRTIALAIRLFGNVMSGGMIVGILLSIAPFIFPIIMNALGLLTGIVQAYIFGVLATVYIAAAVQGSNSDELKLTTNK